MNAAPHPLKGGELARLTAATLTTAGLHVTGPRPADAEGCRLIIRAHGARYSLLVSDDAQAELQTETDDPDPHHLAQLAAALLSSHAPAPQPDASPSRSITYKGIAGTTLRAAGYHVNLNVYPDDHDYDVTADISVTDPRTPNSGTAYLTDQGGLTWYRDYWDDHAETTPGPRHRTWLPDPPAAARHIAATITRALSARHGTRAPLQATRGHDHG
ncbi:MAG: hypothetical protein ACRDOI_43960 [Trebonia sp.]